MIAPFVLGTSLFLLWIAVDKVHGWREQATRRNVNPPKEPE